jgi:hypothetical protein
LLSICDARKKRNAIRAEDMGSRSRSLRARTNVHAVNFLRRFGREFMNKYLGWAVALVVSLGIGGLGAQPQPSTMAMKAPAYRAPPPVVVWDWSGFYIGGNVGGAWTNRTTDTMPFTTPGNSFANCGAPARVALPKLTAPNPFDLSTNCSRPSSVIGGGQVGYNWQQAVCGCSVWKPTANGST